MLSVLKSFSIKLSQLTAIKRIARPHSLCKVPSAGSLETELFLQGAGSLDTEQSLQGAGSLGTEQYLQGAGSLGTEQYLQGARCREPRH